VNASSSPLRGFQNWIDRRFLISARGSTLRTEIIAGLAVFTTMSYVLVVNPQVLAVAGMDFKGLITVTAVAAALFSALMGFWSNYPLALAPGIGINVFFAVQICLGMNIPWQSALGLVFYSGILFFIIAVTGLRQKIMEAFPDELKAAITAGIGLFIAFVGMKNAGIIIGHPRNLVTLGNLFAPIPMLGLGGLLLGLVLLIRRVPGALVLTILAISCVGLFIPTSGGGHVTSWPKQVIAWPSSMSKLFLKLDFTYFWSHPVQSVPIVLSLLFADLFGSMAALLAICSRAGLTSPDGKLDHLKQALMADATAGFGGAMLGTSPTHYYIESAVGVAEGGRTGVVSIVVAFCFVLSLFLNPIIQVIPSVATAPALIMIGIFMIEVLRRINLENLEVSGPTVITVLLMVLGSITDGLSIGFLSYIFIQVAIGKGRGLSVVTYSLGGIFLLHYILPFLLPTK
jgi:AGZA family xanthine/uracil permease-like MFS transporter